MKTSPPMNKSMKKPRPSQVSEVCTAYIKSASSLLIHITFFPFLLFSFKLRTLSRRSIVRCQRFQRLQNAMKLRSCIEQPVRT